MSADIKEMPFIPIAKPVMGEEEWAAVKGPVTSGWVTQGPKVKEFEQAFAAYVGAKHACAVSSCTTALHLALLAAGVQPGDEVITVSHTFIATANSIRYCGALPVFVDIQPDTFNMDPALVEKCITPKTKAILCVHQMGMPCDLAAIVRIGTARGIPVIEDAACAIGSEILYDGKWEKIGKPHGDAACFSFHPRKVITTGDGGMVTTNHPEWDEKIRLWRQHGMSVSDTKRHSSKCVIFESYPVFGFNYRMTDLQAAIGLVQLTRLPEIIERRRFLGDRYRQLLAGIDGLAAPHVPLYAKSNWQSYCVRLPQGVDQREVMQAMLDRNIATRRGIMCIHREESYPAGTWVSQGGLSHSEAAQDQCILLPLYVQMTEHEPEFVAITLKGLLQRKIN